MIKKFLACIALVFLFGCSYDNKTNFGIERSNIGNLSFKDIKKIKEYKSCSDASVGILRAFLVFPLFMPDNNEYSSLEYNVSNLVDHHGDSSISSAVKLGSITNIKMIDYSYEVTGIFARRYCVIVYGE